MLSVVALTQREAQALVEACWHWEAVAESLAALGGGTGLPIHVHATALRELRAALAAYADLTPATAWARGVPVVGPVLAAGLAVELAGMPPASAEHLLRLSGQHRAARTLCWGEAERLYARFYRDAPCLRREQVLALAAATGRNLAAGWTSQTEFSRPDVLAWLVHLPYSAFLREVTERIGHNLARGDAPSNNRFTRSYRERLAWEARCNASGLYHVAARKQWERGHWDSPEEGEKLRQGRLTRAQIEEKARRWVVRLFLLELHKRLVNGHAPATVEPIA